jgi:hypothetical protein
LIATTAALMLLGLVVSQVTSDKISGDAKRAVLAGSMLMLQALMQMVL